MDIVVISSLRKLGLRYLGTYDKYRDATVDPHELGHSHLR